MHEKHQAGLTKFFGYTQALPGTQFRSEGRLEINLAATAGEARNAVRGNLTENAVAVPSRTQRFRNHKRVVLVVGVFHFAGRRSHAQSRNGSEGFRKEARVFAACADP